MNSQLQIGLNHLQGGWGGSGLCYQGVLSFNLAASI